MTSIEFFRIFHLIFGIHINQIVSLSANNVNAHGIHARNCFIIQLLNHTFFFNLGGFECPMRFCWFTVNELILVYHKNVFKNDIKLQLVFFSNAFSMEIKNLSSFFINQSNQSNRFKRLIFKWLQMLLMSQHFIYCILYFCVRIYVWIEISTRKQKRYKIPDQNYKNSKKT